MPKRTSSFAKRMPWAVALVIATAGVIRAQTFTAIKTFGVLTEVNGSYPRSQLVQGTDGTLYGTTSGSEGNLSSGTVFKLQPDGSGFTVLKLFTDSVEGADPRSGLTLSANTLYGTTSQGGSFGKGTVYKVNTDGSDFVVLRSFAATEEGPTAGVTLSGNTLYGTTPGGAFSGGTLFKIHTDGTGFAVLKNFTGSDGLDPWAGVTLSGNTLYGTTAGGGKFNSGTVFKVDTDGSAFSLIKHFTGLDAGTPRASVTVAGSTLYGTTAKGGDNGTVFKVNTDGSDFAVLKSFAPTNGGAPIAGVTLSGNTIFGTMPGGDFGAGMVFKVGTDGTGFAVLKRFKDYDGDDLRAFNPVAGVAISGETLYGTGVTGGTLGFGGVFRINLDGADYKVLKDFAFKDGLSPNPGLVLLDGTLFGTTSGGGTSGNGTIFKVGTDGTGYTVLKNFSSARLIDIGVYKNWDGAQPLSGMKLSGHTLFGTAHGGGALGYGTLFKMNIDGTGYTVLHDFSEPPIANLVLSEDEGSVYGMTEGSGYIGVHPEPNTSWGTLFKAKTDGSDYTTLWRFGFYDGNPISGLFLANRKLYGATESPAGDRNASMVFQVGTDDRSYSPLAIFHSGFGGLTFSGGTLYATTFESLFKLGTNGGGSSLLKNFFEGSANNYRDGLVPSAGLVVSGNTIYGSTLSGGSSNYGTIFRVNTDGSRYIVLKNLTRSEVGGQGGQGAALAVTGATLSVLSGNMLYGTTWAGGPLGIGTVFRIDLDSPLTIQRRGQELILSWTDPAATLQAAPRITGGYINVAGASSPYTIPVTDEATFFRLSQ